MDGRMCSPADDKFLNRKRKCRDCPICPLGTGRTLTHADTVRDTLVNTKCLPCEECPAGYFNNQLGFTSECRPCTEDMCSSLKRSVQKQCNTYRDHICGSCLPGFQDDFQDTRYACNPKTTEPAILDRTIHNGSLDGTSRFVNPNLLHNLSTTGVLAGSGLTIHVISITLGLILAVVITIAALICRRRSCCSVQLQTFENGACVAGHSNSTLNSNKSEGSSLLSAHEAWVEYEKLETDCPESVGQRLADYSHVRGELESVSMQPSTVGGIPVTPSSAGREIPYTDFDRLCQCRNACCGEGCRQSDRDTELVPRHSGLLTHIACAICHDPTQLFRYLEITDADLYNIDDDRKRFPEKISQQQFIHSVLQRWVEVQAREAKFGKLRQALCKSHFHRINDTVLCNVGVPSKPSTDNS